MLGWYPFPHYLQHPDGRNLKTAAYLLRRLGYTALADDLGRMADTMLAVEPEPIGVDTDSAALMKEAAGARAPAGSRQA